MKKVFLFLVLSVCVFANDGVHNYAKSKECKSCHPKIYKEYYTSMHANSVANKDVIHNSVWAKHPQNLKQKRYECGKCHTPAANNLDQMLKKGGKALPDANNETHQEAISCAYCHRIKDIAIHKRHNTNIISKKEKLYFATKQNHIKSPFHGIVTDGNEHMKNGNVCIGCHSHKMNKWGLNVCSTNNENTMNGANCVSCHMPKVKGSVSILNETKKHSFHGFAGTHFHSNMLRKYVDISILRNINDFLVNIDNRTSHALLLHPLRQAVLKVKVTRGDKTIKLKDKVFVRVIGANGKPAMPWAAKKDIKNNMIKANEKRVIKYNFKLQKGDKVNVVLGWYLVMPKALKMLKLQNEEVAKKFIVFKNQNFKF